MTAKQHDWKVTDLLRLNQRERLKEFVKSAKPAWKDDECKAVLNKHHLANKEVFERETKRLVRIWSLLKRLFDVASD